jgi:hypothetical protein
MTRRIVVRNFRLSEKAKSSCKDYWARVNSERQRERLLVYFFVWLIENRKQWYVQFAQLTSRPFIIRLYSKLLPFRLFDKEDEFALK